MIYCPRIRPAHVLASFTLLFPSLVATAQEVTLSSSDGLFSASGELVSLENGIYIISTTLGNMQISEADVTCEGAACPSPEPEVTELEVDVRFAGSDTIGDGLVPLLLAGYGASHNAFFEELPTNDGTVAVNLVEDEGYGDSIGVFQVASATSSDAFSELLDKSAEIGMASRRITRDEARALAQDGSGSMIALEQEHIVAVDNLVVVINPSIPVSTISVVDLAGIYRGEIRNWSALGGPNLRITPFTRSQRTGTRASFDGVVFGNSNTIQVARIAGTNESMSATISVTPGAIGFVGYAFINDAKPVSLVSSCGIETNPDTFSAKTEEYLMQRRLFLYTRQDNTTEAGQQFLNYALSTEADGVVTKSGYIGLSPERISQELARSRAQSVMDATTSVFELNLMREMVLEMYQWDRLSTTFRFASGSNNLERKSLLDLGRLIDYLQNQPAGTKIAVVGFTDSDGVFNANHALSQRRARQVLAEIEAKANGALDHIVFETQGFGELAPAGCNTNNNGKRINRRVEVWIQ